MVESQHDSLPSWWFEVDDEDDIDTNTSLLQELEIDLPQIYRYTIMLIRFLILYFLSTTLLINLGILLIEILFY
jgi:hypothetical protein